MVGRREFAWTPVLHDAGDLTEPIGRISAKLRNASKLRARALWGAMFDLDFSAVSLDSVAHVIQLALTPLFLLAGLAGLLNVFSTRLGRVADIVDRQTEALKTARDEEAKSLRGHLDFLRHRSLVLDAAVVLGTIGGAATCAATLTLFVGALRNATIAGILFTLFGVAILSTLGALAAFLVEVLMAGKSLRKKARTSRLRRRC